MFNMGVGLVVCVERDNVSEVLNGTNGFVLGEVVKQKGITLKSGNDIIIRGGS